MTAKMPALLMALVVLCALCTVVQGGTGFFERDFKEFEHFIDFEESQALYPSSSSSLHLQNFAMQDDAALDMMVRFFATRTLFEERALYHHSRAHRTRMYVRPKD